MRAVTDLLLCIQACSCNLIPFPYQGGQFAADGVGDAGPAKPKPWLKFINRQKLMLRLKEVGRLAKPDHPLRAIWELVGRVSLEPFYQRIETVKGVAGREPFDPQSQISIWIYA